MTNYHVYKDDTKLLLWRLFFTTEQTHRCGTLGFDFSRETVEEDQQDHPEGRESTSAKRNLEKGRFRSGAETEKCLLECWWKFRVELHEVPGCLCNTRVSFIAFISQTVFPRLRGVTFHLTEFLFQEGEILKICSVITHPSFSGSSPQPEIWRKMRFSVLGFWLRHCDSGNLLPDTCSWRHRSRLSVSSQNEASVWKRRAKVGSTTGEESFKKRKESRGEMSEVTQGDAVTEPPALPLHKRLCKNRAVLQFCYKKIHHFTPARNLASFSPFQQSEGRNISDQTREASSEEAST